MHEVLITTGFVYREYISAST